MLKNLFTTGKEPSSTVLSLLCVIIFFNNTLYRQYVQNEQINAPKIPPNFSGSSSPQYTNWQALPAIWNCPQSNLCINSSCSTCSTRIRILTETIRRRDLLSHSDVKSCTRTQNGDDRGDLLVWKDSVWANIFHSGTTVGNPPNQSETPQNTPETVSNNHMRPLW